MTAYHPTMALTGTGRHDGLFSAARSWWPISLGWLMLVCILLTAGCDGSGPPEGVPETTALPRACITYGDVRGPLPNFGPQELGRFGNDNAMCSGWWLPKVNDHFVPQGLAIGGKTAWVTGYRWRPGYGERECRLMQVDLRTGALLAYMPRISGSVDGRPEAYCHHGGGIARTPDGLWVLETKRLWLLDPYLVKTGRDPVVKVWFIEKPLRGSVLVTTGEEFGVGEFREDRHGDIHWFRYEDIEAPGVTTLVRHGARRTARQVPARRVIPAPRYLQGAATVPAHSAAGRSTASGTWFVSSNTRCGVLHRPDGSRVAFGPGSEGIDIDRRGDFWVVMEAGVLDYQRQGGRPMVPHLARFDGNVLSNGVADSCSW